VNHYEDVIGVELQQVLEKLFDKVCEVLAIEKEELM